MIHNNNTNNTNNTNNNTSQDQKNRGRTRSNTEGFQNNDISNDDTLNDSLNDGVVKEECRINLAVWADVLFDVNSVSLMITPDAERLLQSMKLYYEDLSALQEDDAEDHEEDNEKEKWATNESDTESSSEDDSDFEDVQEFQMNNKGKNNGRDMKDWLNNVTMNTPKHSAFNSKN